MWSIQRIQIQNMCKHHSLPYTHICITKYCQCQIKLCQKCCTQHENQNQNSSLLKIQNYLNKIETEVEISSKQYQKINSIHQENIKSSQKNNQTQPTTLIKSLQETKDKYEKFALNQVKILEDSMKYLNEESSKVNKQIKQASQVLNAKMSNIQLKRKQIPEKFAKKVYQNNILQNLIKFYNQKGFGNFRKKLDKMMQFRGMLKDFLAYADKFGKKYEQFMKCSSTTVSSQLSMKGTIQQILPKNKQTKEKANTEENFYQPENLQNIRKNNFSNNNDQQILVRQKRAKTIFGKNI